MTSVNPHPREPFSAPASSLDVISRDHDSRVEHISHSHSERNPLAKSIAGADARAPEPVIRLDGFDAADGRGAASKHGAATQEHKAQKKAQQVAKESTLAQLGLESGRTRADQSSSNDEEGSPLERLQRSTDALLAYTRSLEQKRAKYTKAGHDRDPSVKARVVNEAERSHQHRGSIGEQTKPKSNSDVASGTAFDIPFEMPFEVPFEVPFEKDTFCLNGKSLLESVVSFGSQVMREPQVFLSHYSALAKEMLSIVKGSSAMQPERGDRRFRDQVWSDNPIYRCVLQTYLAWSKELDGLLRDLNFEDEADRKRAQFLLNQLVAAAAPSNSPLNPVAVKRAFQTGGLSVVAGLRNFVDDLSVNHGMPRQTERGSFTLGKDLATTAGAVVFRSEVLELIQYGCQSETVYQRPTLFIPPQINKFYIFDLAAKNSLVQHLLKSGQQVFIVSWKNPDKASAAWNLDTYVEHLDQAVDVIGDICKSKDLNLVSACAGGLTATALQAYYQGLRDQKLRDQGLRDQKLGNQKLGNQKLGDQKTEAQPLKAEPQQDGAEKLNIVSHSMLVTALSAREHPTLDLFINKRAVSYSLARSARRGVMDGRELAHVFAFLRPVDLVWNFWVNNCLLGKEPPTMDVLYWDNDSTRLPAGLHRDFTEIVVHDRYARPNSFEVKGEKVDLSQIESEFYFLGGEEDYLMPWKNCFRNMALLPKAKCTYVLSDSGHIQSVLRPPGIGNIAYYTNGTHADEPEQWLASAQKNSGSWWLHWSAWLGERGGDTKAAPERVGNNRYPPLCAAPGTYVLES